jgi:DnaJ-class molecular chaperone
MANHENEIENDEPTGRWEICSSCEGEGRHAKRFGAMTMSEFHEAFDDAESREGYFAGAYDERCDVCMGRGMIRDTEESRARLDRQSEHDRICMTGRNDAGEPIGYC